MSLNTVIQQGRFTSDGLEKRLSIRSDVDWMEVINLTQMATQQTPGRGIRFEWQRGFMADGGVRVGKLDGVDTTEETVLASGGFTLLDTSNPNTLGPLNATVTAVSAAATPVVSATSTAGLSNGSVVRMVNVTGAQQLGGIDFTIDSLVANTSFDLAYMSQIVAGTTGSFYPVKYDPIYYPRRRTISAITQAASAVVTMTVTHGFTVGQKIRMEVPAENGMSEMDGLSATITAVDTANNTITIDVDSTAFSAFVFPLTAGVPFTPAQVVPLGEAAESPYENLLDDATRNTAILGMLLAAGAQSPAGSNNDVIYWRAGKSFSDLDEI